MATTCAPGCAARWRRESRRCIWRNRSFGCKTVIRQHSNGNGSSSTANFGNPRIRPWTPSGARPISSTFSTATPHLQWSETNCLLLRRGPYVIAAGLDESIGGPARTLRGRFINLFDSELRLQREVTLSPGTRFVLLDIDAPEVSGRALLASACRAVPLQQGTDAISFQIEGVANTPGAALLRAARAPRSVLLAGQAPEAVHYDAEQGLLWLRFTNQASPRELTVQF